LQPFAHDNAPLEFDRILFDKADKLPRASLLGQEVGVEAEEIAGIATWIFLSC
jgi:hypothetical protein